MNYSDFVKDCSVREEQAFSRGKEVQKQEDKDVVFSAQQGLLREGMEVERLKVELKRAWEVVASRNGSIDERQQKLFDNAQTIEHLEKENHHLNTLNKHLSDLLKMAHSLDVFISGNRELLRKLADT